MSYTPTEWKSGDIVTSEKLNKLEQGVANGGGNILVVEEADGQLTETYKDIVDALYTTGVILEIKTHDPELTALYRVVNYGHLQGEEEGEAYDYYTLEFFSGTASSSHTKNYAADTVDDYPINDD